MFYRKAFAVLAISIWMAGPAFADDVAVKLQKASINIKVLGFSNEPVQGMVSAQASGSIIKTKTKEGAATFVLTAAHVVESLRSVKTEIKDGKEVKRIEYLDAQIVQEQISDGRVVGEIRYYAKVINVDYDRDIALLRVRLNDLGPNVNGIEFYLDEKIPEVGTELYHVGAPGGQRVGGTATVTYGIIARVGAKIEEFGGSEHGIYDATTCLSLPGSSGGMVCRKSDGKFVGMITLGIKSGDSFSYIVPVRSVKKWAQKINIEWLLDPSKPRPSEEEINKIPLELGSKDNFSDMHKDRKSIPVRKASIEVPISFGNLITNAD